MNTNPISWFEIPVNDTERAKAFYEKFLGIELTRQDIPNYEMVRFPMNMEMYGASGALMKGDGYHPGENGPVIYFHCPDIEAYLARGEQAGGKIKLPKKDVGEGGYIGWIWDTEGNIVALHTPKVM